LNDICKYYKIVRKRSVDEYIFPDFITAIIENKQVMILDCMKFKPDGVIKDEF